MTAQALDKSALHTREARAARLIYSADNTPGFQRLRAGKGFRYKTAKGVAIRQPHVLARIRALAIPPAWCDVWICPNPRGHLQATGRDARGRKQYCYHAAWHERRDGTKYDRLLDFGKTLPVIRRRVRRDLRLQGFPKEKVLAAVVQLLDVSHIRVGNEEYAQSNNSYGLTTLTDRHVKVRGAQIRFQFAGKSGVRHTIELRDQKLAKIVKSCQDLPGQKLFQYVGDDRRRRPITSADVNDYLRNAAGKEITAKDFRTWAGTVFALVALTRNPPGTNEAQTKRLIVEAVAEAAERLGNSNAVCRKAYIHPTVFEAFAAGQLLTFAARRVTLRGLSADERATLAFLKTLV